MITTKRGRRLIKATRFLSPLNVSIHFATIGSTNVMYAILLNRSGLYVAMAGR